MANKTGPQPNIQFCPACKGELRNVPRSEMKSHGASEMTEAFLSSLTHMNAWIVK